MPTSLNPGAAAKPSPARRAGVRELAAQATRESILRAATKVFAAHGFDGGGVDQIAKAAKSHVRMIYYYFGSKDLLFTAVLEDLYRRFNEAEAAVHLDLDKPAESLKTVIQFVWNYYQKNPEFITLLNSENLYRGKHLTKSGHAHECARPAIGILDQVLKSGAAKGLFRKGVLARDVYMMIAAMGYFYLSNRYTLSATLGEELTSAEAKAHWESFVIDAVLRTIGR
jgi:AcrR family transcriptional regulator